MPIYQYRNPNTGEVIEVIQGMKDKHEYVDENGVACERVWHSPNAAIDSHIDAFSENDFVNKTRNKKSSMGDFWDMSRELKEKREQKSGAPDEVQRKYMDEWSSKRKGKKHPSTGSQDIIVG
jgi:predicted nucleic acid-binding Zn ribbon protein